MKNMGYPDKPVDNINEDLFNVEVYVNALCSFIKSCDTPMTVSIQGDWGSGKTSMMNMMKVNMQGSVWPIWFNTWQFSQFDMGNSLAFSMVDILLKGLGCDKEIRKKIIGGLAGLGKKAIKVIAENTVGGKAASTLGSLMDGDNDITDYAAEIVELKNKFQKAVNDKLAKENRDRIVVFVDDLDRLQPSKAVELLEVLKLFLDCENCVFVLAVDYEVVSLGIRQKFGAEVSDEKGKSFFDKIIQLPFKMPVASYDIHNYVQKMMTKIGIPTSAENVNLFFNLIKTSIGFNPRSMKRLFNIYELLDIVTKSITKNIPDEVRKRELFAIVCTQMCFESFYQYLSTTPSDVEFFDAIQSENMLSVLCEVYECGIDEELPTELVKLKAYLPYFMSAIQIDDDKAVSEKEVNYFRAILQSSTVTSLSSAVENSDSESHEWEYRNKNKEIVKAVAEKLKTIGEFSVWMPRKARAGVKYSDISGWNVWETEAGIKCSLEYYLSRVNEYTISVSIGVGLYDGKGQEEKFFEIFGSNPLKLNRKPEIKDWGKYYYSEVLRLNADDVGATEQIVSLTKNAFGSLESLIKQYNTEVVQ